MSEDTNINPYSLIADFDGNVEDIFNIDGAPQQLPVIPLRNLVLFPGIVVPVAVERPFSMKVIKRAFEKNEFMGVVYQRDPETDEPKATDVHSIGTFVKVMRIIELPDGRITALLQGYCRFIRENFQMRRGTYKVTATPLLESDFHGNDKEIDVLIDTVRERTVKYMRLNDNNAEESRFAIKNIHNRVFLINFICTNISIPLKEKIEILYTDTPKDRAMRLLAALDKQMQFAALKADIKRKTREDLDQQQKEYFLQQEIRNIHEELGDDGNSEILEL